MNDGADLLSTLVMMALIAVVSFGIGTVAAEKPTGCVLNEEETHESR